MSEQGRFTSPDDFLNDTHAYDLASWNLYVYVRNNLLFSLNRPQSVVNGKQISERKLTRISRS